MPKKAAPGGCFPATTAPIIPVPLAPLPISACSATMRIRRSPAAIRTPRGGSSCSPLPLGIDCQRCHGPAQRHVDLASRAGANAEEIRAAIVNPKRLSPDREAELCLKCHLETTSGPLPKAIRKFDREPFSTRPAPGRFPSDLRSRRWHGRPLRNRAELELETAILLQPDLWRAQFELGVVLGRKRQYAAAEEHLKLAAQGDDPDAKASALKSLQQLMR